MGEILKQIILLVNEEFHMWKGSCGHSGGFEFAFEFQFRSSNAHSSLIWSLYVRVTQTWQLVEGGIW